MMQRATILFAIVSSTLLLGCGPSRPKTYTATGEVTFDGDPVSEGEIIFRAADGSQGSWEGRVSGGSYKLETTPGKKHVEITARRKTEGQPAAASGEPAFSIKQYISEKYNAKSDLTAEITTDGENRFDYALEP